MSNGKGSNHEISAFAHVNDFIEYYKQKKFWDN